jgi:hypothetical protein
MEVERREQELKAQLNQERIHSEQLAKDLEIERLKSITPDPDNTEPQNLLAQIVSFTLISDTVRSTGGIPRLEISTNTKTMKLTMIFTGDDHKNVIATIKRVGSTNILQKAELKAQSKGLMKHAVRSLPAKSIAEADYILTLATTDESGAVIEIDRYPLRVVKK